VVFFSPVINHIVHNSIPLWSPKASHSVQKTPPVDTLLSRTNTSYGFIAVFHDRQNL